MDGIILLNKEKDISSFKAINKLKHKIGLKKVGHAGTLDPLAEGLMIVLANDATKLSDLLLKQDKEYMVECELGYETDTYDLEGVRTKEFDGEVNLSKEEIINGINEFQGEYDQVPPMYSAIKINGKKLYDLARKGIEVERKSKIVNINYIKDINLDENKVSFTISVSSGTYIRSIIRDFGRKLGTYATMTELTRTKIGKFNIEDSRKMDDIEDQSSGIGVQDIFDFERIDLGENEYFKLKNGVKIAKVGRDSYYSIYFNGEYKGIGIIEGNILRRFRYFLVD
ncbi:MAG: tRNA pseudouridine(55) synthase TruB [Sebaldella sp.]|nr:tRNA pseudouridine(55) synthase TruB [Sebaldella sp.]